MGFHPAWVSYYIFSLAFAATFVAMWTSLVHNRNFVVYSDPETVPAPTDIISTVLGIEALDAEESVAE